MSFLDARNYVATASGLPLNRPSRVPTVASQRSGALLCNPDTNFTTSPDFDTKLHHPSATLSSELDRTTAPLSKFLNYPPPKPTIMAASASAVGSYSNPLKKFKSVSRPTRNPPIWRAENADPKLGLDRLVFLGEQSGM